MAQEREGARLAGRLQLPDYDWTASGTAVKGVYPTVTYKRPDGTTYMTSVLTNPDGNQNWQTDTWTFYEADGATVSETHVWTFVFDSSSVLTSAVMA